MKRIRLLALLGVLCTSPGWALPVIEFSPDASTAGNWTYSAGLDVLSYNQNIVVNRGASSNSDGLVQAKVFLPTMRVTGSNGYYTLQPLGNQEIRITNAAGNITYLTGTLDQGDLATIGTIGAGYSQFNTDITNIVVTPAGQVLGSAALDIINRMTTPTLDFELALNGGSNSNFTTFAQMLDGGYSGSGGFSGAMSVPEPATVALLGCGGWSLARRRRRRYQKT